MTEQYEHAEGTFDHREYTKAAEIIADVKANRGKGSYREERDRRLACACPGQNKSVLRVFVGPRDDGTPVRWIVAAGWREPAVSNSDGSPIPGAPNIPPAPPMCATYFNSHRAAVIWQVIEQPAQHSGVTTLREDYMPLRTDGYWLASPHGGAIHGHFEPAGTWVPEPFQLLPINVRCPRCYTIWALYENMRIPGEIHVVLASWPTRGRLIPA